MSGQTIRFNVEQFSSNPFSQLKKGLSQFLQALSVVFRLSILKGLLLKVAVAATIFLTILLLSESFLYDLFRK